MKEDDPSAILESAPAEIPLREWLQQNFTLVRTGLDRAATPRRQDQQIAAGRYFVQINTTEPDTGAPIRGYNGIQGLFDWTTDHNIRQGAFSFWLNSLSTSGQLLTFFSVQPIGSLGTNHWVIQRDTSNRLVVGINDINGAGQTNFNSVTAITVVDSNWHHICGWWNQDTASPVAHIWLDGVALSVTTTTLNQITGSNSLWKGRSVVTLTNDRALTLNTAVNYMIGEFWLDTRPHDWPSTTAFPALFRSSGGAPLNLGTRGEIPHSAIPDFYISGEGQLMRNYGRAGDMRWVSVISGHPGPTSSLLLGV